MLELNDKTFNDSTNKGRVLLDFYTTWCGPCKVFAPTFKKWSEEHKDVSFAKVNVEDAIDVSTKFKIGSIPTIVLLEDGKEVKRWVGIPNEKEVMDLIDKA